MDFKKIENNYFLFKNNGQKKLEIDLKEFILKLTKLSFGELMINYINNDGSGIGLDLNLIDLIPSEFSKPLIISGGIGNYKHIINGLKNSRVSAISTANLLNFLGDGLELTRDNLIKNDLNFPQWNKELIMEYYNMFK